jgi:hypothetical protein
MDIQALTYNKLSPMDTGRINMMYRRVQCVPPKPMVIYVDNNGGQGSWLRLFIEVTYFLGHPGSPVRAFDVSRNTLLITSAAGSTHTDESIPQYCNIAWVSSKSCVRACMVPSICILVPAGW